jgi:hypothetical protein
MARGCPIVRVGSRAAAITGLNHALAAHPMVRSCPPNAWRISRAATIDRDRLHAMIPRKMATISVAGTASGCMRWLGGTAPEGRDDLPDGMAPAGGAWDGVRMRSSCARLDAMTVGCPSLGWRPRAFPAIPFPPRWRPDACPGITSAGVPRAGLSRHCMRALRWRSDA